METSAAPESGRPAAGPADKPPKLSEELAGLQARFTDQPVTLQEVILVLRGRAYLLLVILLALPFCTPIPLPGLSTPLGLVIALVSLRLALGQRPWLPRKLLGRQLPPGFLGKVFAATTGSVRFLEKFLRPRVAPLTEVGLLRRMHAVMMFLAALVLLLPLPIPFTNTIPAWAIILIAGGLMERDGAAIVAGYGFFASGLLYFIFLGGATHQLLDAFQRLLAG
ncbi:MAG: exopolysaccharide biosynthesis protein [Opitutaceae bacterium]|nr:exopolysaccharide biosynthesis protein [Opitutaceae bacterium]